MATIHHGSCVGVQYGASHGAECVDGHCVHNGRFVGAVTGRSGNTLTLARSISTEHLHSSYGIVLSHWAISPEGHAHLQHLFFNKSRLQDIGLTPFSQYTSCQSTQNYNDLHTIYPGECVGIKYKKAERGRSVPRSPSQSHLSLRLSRQAHHLLAPSRCRAPFLSRSSPCFAASSGAIVASSVQILRLVYGA